MQQEEYSLAYALVFAVIALALVAMCIPRPRKVDIPENLAKKAMENRIAAGKKSRAVKKIKVADKKK